MRIVEIKRTEGPGGAVQFTVESEWDDGEGVVNHSFVGSIYGAPGPVLLILSTGLATPVINPERFGVRLDETWVRNFYNNPKDD